MSDCMPVVVRAERVSLSSDELNWIEPVQY